MTDRDTSTPGRAPGASITLALAAIVAGASTAVPVLGTLAGIVTLVLPGALACRLVARGQRLHGVAAVALAATLTMASVVGIGLVLTLFHSVHRTGWSIGLTCLSLLLALVDAAAESRDGDPRHARAAGGTARNAGLGAPRLRPAPAPRHGLSATHRVRALGAATASALVLLGAALTISVITAQHEDSLPFSVLALRVLPNQDVELHVRNENSEREAYTLQLAAPKGVVRSWSFVLEPGQVQTVSDPAAVPGRLVARLHRAGDPQPVTREVWLDPGNRGQLARAVPTRKP